MNFFSNARQFGRRYRLITALSTFVAVSCVPGTGAADTNDQLSHVPSDTFLYMGNLEPFSISRWMEFFPGLQGGGMSQMIETMLEEQQEAAKSGAPGADLLASDGYASFMRAYGDFLENPKENMAHYGIDAEAIEMSFYMQGVSPVLRVRLADREQFMAAFDELDTKQGYQPLVQPVSGNDVRLYEAESDLANQPRLAVSVVGQDAVFALSYNDSDLLQVLGIDSLESNLSTVDTLPQLQDKYGYTSNFVGYLDFERLAQTFTDADSESGKRLIAAMQEKDETAQLRTPECQSELQQIASIWPRMVFGYQALDMTDDTALMDAHMAIEINHPGITSALSKLRGHIPQSVQSADSVFSFALGLDVSRLGQSVGELAMLMSGFNYKCSSLSAFNNITPQTMQQAVMGVNMVSGMAQGVRGLSMSLFDVDVEAAKDGEGGAPTLNKFDALINIPAQNPQLLLNMAKAIPQLAGFNIPADGTPVEIGQDLAAQMGQELDVDVNVAQRGKQIVLFSGDEASSLAQDTTAAVEEDNGFFQLSGNLARFSDLMKRMGHMMPSDSGDATDQEFTEQMEMIADMYPDGRYGYVVDFTDRGIEINTYFDVTKTQ